MTEVVLNDRCAWDGLAGVQWRVDGMNLKTNQAGMGWAGACGPGTDLEQATNPSGSGLELALICLITPTPLNPEYIYWWYLLLNVLLKVGLRMRD